jgi:hypothetical protein
VVGWREVGPLSENLPVGGPGLGELAGLMMSPGRGQQLIERLAGHAENAP